MTDQFEIEKRILAMNPLVIQSLMQSLLAEYGTKMKSGDNIIQTLGVFQNTKNREDGIYPCDFGINITPMVLTDGRFAFDCYWNTGLASDFIDEKNGVITYSTVVTEEEVDGVITTTETQVQNPPRFTDVEEITQEQLLALLPTPEQLSFP